MNMHRYAAFGLAIDSEVRLPLPGMPTGSPAAVTITTRGAPVDEADSPPLVDMPLRTHGKDVRFQVLRTSAGPLIRVSRVGDFVVGDASVACWLNPERWQGAEVRFLLTSALVLWLELRRYPVLHGASVDIDGRATVLLAPGGTGKSTLAASLCARGFRLLGDDLVVLRPGGSGIEVLPSYPHVGLWPSSLLTQDFASLSAAPREYPTMEKRMFELPPNAFSRGAVPVGTIHVLRRRRLASGRRLAIRALTPVELLLQCVGQSVSRATVQALGLQPRRLEILASLAQQAPGSILTYESGATPLVDVCDFLTSRAAVPAHPEG